MDLLFKQLHQLGKLLADVDVLGADPLALAALQAVRGPAQLQAGGVEVVLGLCEGEVAKVQVDVCAHEQVWDGDVGRAALGAVPAGGAAAGAGAAGYAATQHFDSPSQYSDDTALALDADSAAAAQAEEEKALRRQYGKRGTIDFGLLFIRIALGGFLIVEGVRTLFSIGESAGISGLESEYASYSMANILAMGIPVGQLVAGVFLVLGLLTPFASMLALVVTGFMAIHELAVSGAGLDVFSWPESLWLALVLFVVNIGVQFTGPGFISVDSALGVKALSSPARRPLASSWVFFILGAAALVAVWWFGAGINPLN